MTTTFWHASARAVNYASQKAWLREAYNYTTLRACAARVTFLWVTFLWVCTNDIDWGSTSSPFLPSCPVVCSRFSAARSICPPGRQVKYPSVSISMGRTCSTPMVRRVASLGLIADSWYSVAHDLPWSWWWEWVLVTRACNKVSVHILSYATSTTTNDGAQWILQHIDWGQC